MNTSVSALLQDYARSEAAYFTPLSCIPNDYHSHNISYLFIYSTGEKWDVELIVDPSLESEIGNAWSALVKELTTSVLPFFSLSMNIGGYYPICTITDCSFVCPFPCLRLTKNPKTNIQDVLIPDCSTNYDTLSLDMRSNINELPSILFAMDLEDEDDMSLLSHDNITAFLYVSQLVLCTVLPFKPYLNVSELVPYVFDSGHRLYYNLGSLPQQYAGLGNLMNDVFFAKYYNGFSYLAGEYPYNMKDVEQCRQRTLTPMPKPDCTSFIGMSDPNKILSALASKQIVSILNEDRDEFCFSTFLEPGKHYIDTANPTMSLSEEDVITNQFQYIHTWSNAVTKRCYLIELFNAIATRASIVET